MLAGICSIEKDKHEATAFQQVSQITRLRAQEMFTFFRLFCDVKRHLLQQPKANFFVRLSKRSVLRFLTDRIYLKSCIKEKGHYNSMSCPGLKGTQEKQTKQLGGKSKMSKSIKKCSIKSLLQLLQRKRGAPSPTGRT